MYSCSGKDSQGVKANPIIPNKTAKSGQKIESTVHPSEFVHKYVFKRPKHVRGLYLTAWSAGSPTLREHLLAIVDRTELNSVVIDIRDLGQMFFKTGIKLADECHANKIAVPRPAGLFASLEKHGVWPIARIACFKDVFVPIVHPELAVQLKGGKLWKDRNGKTWLDPYNKKNWAYIAETVEYALNVGFPEIQLDYVRFPSEGKSATQIFPARGEYAKKGELNEDVISAFAKYIGEKVHSRGAVFSADVFGIISSSKGDQGIGQQLEKVAAPFDVLSPMVYPSHFAAGEYGIADPNRSPYEIIKKSLDDYKKRLPNVHIRPWLQDFSLHGVPYGVSEVKAQIKATRDVGYQSFLLWNAKNKYTEAAVAKKRAGSD